MVKLILTQDRDDVVKFEEGMTLLTVPFFVNGVPSGINFMCEDVLLGTFDTVNEALGEMNKILACEDEFFEVSGFSNYLGDDDFNSMMEADDEID